eukprot:994779_1
MSRQTAGRRNGDRSTLSALGDVTNTRPVFVNTSKLKQVDADVVKPTRILRSRALSDVQENTQNIPRTRKNYSGSKRKNSELLNARDDNRDIHMQIDDCGGAGSSANSAHLDTRPARQRRIITRSAARASGVSSCSNNFDLPTSTQTPAISYFHPGARRSTKRVCQSKAARRSSSPLVGMEDDSLSDSMMSVEAGGSGGIAVASVPAQDEGRTALLHRLSMITDKQVPTTYTEEICQNLRRSECSQMVNPNYMDHQVDVNTRMRTILVDWLIEVHAKFRLASPTLYLTVAYLDRFLARKLVTRARLQLVGCAAMLVAAKYQEIYPPEVILNQLQFRLTTVTPHTFIEWYLLVVRASDDVRQLARMLLELGLLEMSAMAHRPSMIAACALYIAVRLPRFSLWTPLMVELTKYTEHDLQDCAREMYNYLVVPNPREKAIRKKYTTINLDHMIKSHSS